MEYKEYIDYYKDSHFFFHSNRDFPPFTRSYGMHAHDIYELLYLISGQGSIFIEGCEYPLQSSSVYLIRPNEAHYTSLTDSEPYERTVLHFLPSILDSFDPEHHLLEAFDNHLPGRHNFYTLEGTSKLIVENSLKNILQTKDEGYHKKLAILSNLLPVLTELNKLHKKTPQGPPDFPGHDVISEVILYINNHLFDDIHTEDLCSLFFISRSRLNVLFKKRTSTTLWKYISAKRLLAARSMLKAGERAQEVSLQCGFKDYSAFYRAYKQYFGTYPQADMTTDSSFHTTLL